MEEGLCVGTCDSVSVRRVGNSIHITASGVRGDRKTLALSFAQADGLQSDLSKELELLKVNPSGEITMPCDEKGTEAQESCAGKEGGCSCRSSHQSTKSETG